MARAKKEKTLREDVQIVEPITVPVEETFTVGHSEAIDMFDPNNARAVVLGSAGDAVSLRDNSAVFTPPKPLSPDQLPTLQRLKLLGNLGDFCDNAEVRSMIQALPSGELIWDILVTTISEKVELWMAGKAVAAPINVPVGDAYQQAQALAAAMSQFKSQIEHISQADVLRIFGQLAEKISGQRTPQVQVQAPKVQKPLAGDAAALISQLGP